MKIFTILFSLMLGLSAVTGAKAQSPVLRDFNFTPELVDTREGAESVTFTATVSAADGVGNVSGVLIFLYSPPSDAISIHKLQKISSSEAGDVFQITINFPKEIYNRIWQIPGIDILDEAGNRIYLSSSKIAELGFKSSFQVIGQLNVPMPKRGKVKVRFF